MSNWFPIGKNGNEDGWRFDIVSLLAVIGENSIQSHSQALTSSWTCMLPRIIPAPQVLLKPARPNRMPCLPATIVGVHNGGNVPTLNYFPNIIHPVDDLPPYSFGVLRISHKGANAPAAETNQKNPSSATSVELGQVEKGLGANLKRRPTFKDKVKEKLVLPDQERKPIVPPSKYSPLTLLTWFSFVVTLALFASAIYLRDATACVALGTISMVSSITGYASWWEPRLRKRLFNSKVPPGDVVILTREGAFLLVECDENVARELYTGTEECRYKLKTQPYRVLVGFGTFLLMISVVLLGNCNFNMQAAIASAYIVLNGLFWGVSLLDKKHFWDLSVYDCEDITPEDCRTAHEEPPEGIMATDEDKPNYTRTLWYAIRQTKKIEWVKRSGAAPDTVQWQQWLEEARDAAQRDDRDWPAVKRREVLVGGVQVKLDARTDREDIAGQHAPAVDVPPKQFEETKGI